MLANQSKSKLWRPASYRICVQGVLDESWTDIFAGLMITCDPAAVPGPVTTLTGSMIDQAMLLGVLNGLYNLGLSLLLVECLVNGEHGVDGPQVAVPVSSALSVNRPSI